MRLLSENIRLGNPSGKTNDNKDDSPNEDIHEDNEDKAEDSTRECEINNQYIHDSDELGPGKQLQKREECEASYENKQGLYFHTSSKHEGICYLQGVSKKVPTFVFLIYRLLKHLKKWFCTFFNSPAFAESKNNNILILGLKLEKLLTKI